jgi:hypothetical protein
MRISSVFLLASLGWTLAGWAGQVRASPEAAKPGTVSAAAPDAVKGAANGAQDNDKQIICKREEVTGSRLPGPKQCHTRAEWAQINANAATKFEMISAPGLTPTQTATQAGN